MKGRSASKSDGGAHKPQINASLEEIVKEIENRGDPNTLAGMSRFGIAVAHAYGVSVPQLRVIARRIRTDHSLALQLWKTGIHEGRILAGMIDDPGVVTENQMENWASSFDSWDIVDGTCGNLFDKTHYAIKKAHEWSERNEEYVKRAGFVLMAELAVHDKKTPDETFLKFLPVILRESSDERNFVKKAINWALRQIGKRNRNLNTAALRTCRRIQKIDSSSAKWIATDAVRELTSTTVQKKLKNANKRSG